MKLYFTFPNWSRKCVTFSYDDGHVADLRLAETLAKAGLKATFNLVPTRIGQPGRLSVANVRTLLEQRHEVASHGYRHLHLNELAPAALRAEVMDGRRALEDMLLQSVPGFASPYGQHGPAAMDAMREAGMAYARTAGGSHSLHPYPQDWLRWTPTTHHRDALPQAETFAKSNTWGGTLSVMYIWGHAWEFDRDGNWDHLDRIVAALDPVANGIWAATNLEVRDYLEACRAVRLTTDLRHVENPTAFPIYCNYGDDHGAVNTERLVLAPGATFDLADASARAAAHALASAAPAAHAIAPAAPAAPVPVSEIHLAFPDFRRKALTFSYDDGHPADKGVLEILNRHGLRGTFNLCGPKDTADAALAELRGRYAGHELAVHGAEHESWNVTPAATTLSDIHRNLVGLERVAGATVRGSAYPCGRHSKNPRIDALLQSIGVQYARVCEPVTDFSLPDDFMDWHPTGHHNHDIAEIAQRFLDLEVAGDPRLCYIWGHSFEFENQGNWDVLDRFCAALAPHSDTIWFATNIEICDYILAFRSLRWNLTHTEVLNPSAITLCLFVGDRKLLLPPGVTRL